MVVAEPLGRTLQQYRVTVEEYKAFRRDGFLHIRGLVSLMKWRNGRSSPTT